jgi:hypothetical protein
MDLCELKRRWERGKPTLPGEFEPDPRTGAQIVLLIEPPDCEPSELKRRVRGVLGYGPGWMLRAALRDKLTLGLL